MARRNNTSTAFGRWTAITGQTNEDTGVMIDEFYKYHFHNIDKSFWRERWTSMYKVSLSAIYPIENELVSMLNN